MRALVFNGPGNVALTQRPTPEPHDDEVLLRIAATTVCGTDLRIIRGEKTSGIKPGVVLGHEIAGRVECVGGRVRGVPTGQLATMVSVHSCGHCRHCESGHLNICPQAGLLGANFDGGLADYLLVPAAAMRAGYLLLAGASDIDPAQLALTEPLSCCLNGQRQYRVEQGETVLILGAGPIGLFHCILALRRGASNVIVSDPNPTRRAAAATLGATATIDPSATDPGAAVGELTAGRGPDVVVVCVGRPELVSLALQVVAVRGRVSVFAGLPGGSTIPIEPNLIHYKEITVTGASNSGPRDFRAAFDMIAGGSLDLSSIITHRFGLSQVSKAIEFVGTAVGLKVAVIPD